MEKYQKTKFYLNYNDKKPCCCLLWLFLPKLIFIMKQLLALTLATFLFSCNNNDTPDNDPSIVPPSSGIAPPQEISYTVLAQYPHDTSAYTQGLQLYNGKMYEGTGDFENSSLRITNHKTGVVEKKHMMGSQKIFGEGINIFRNKLYQLTWESHIVYVYDLSNLDKPVKTFNWPYEGWGITNNGTDLIISDGSSNIYFVDAETFKVKNTIAVRNDKGPINNINELEYIDGFIYANIYTAKVIIKIDPESGIVKGIMRFDNILSPADSTERTDYFNGIAWDSTSRSMFVTGKRWPKMFELKMN
jgi:glutaminyl-peptide cyclotransferase